jgi:hypothetical protein
MTKVNVSYLTALLDSFFLSQIIILHFIFELICLFASW